MVPRHMLPSKRTRNLLTYLDQQPSSSSSPTPNPINVGCDPGVSNVATQQQPEAPLSLSLTIGPFVPRDSHVNLDPTAESDNVDCDHNGSNVATQHQPSLSLAIVPFVPGRSSINLDPTEESNKGLAKLLAKRESAKKSRARRQEHIANMERKAKLLEVRISKLQEQKYAKDQEIRKINVETQMLLMESKNIELAIAREEAKGKALAREKEMLQLKCWMMDQRMHP